MEEVTDDVTTDKQSKTVHSKWRPVTDKGDYNTFICSSQDNGVYSKIDLFLFKALYFSTVAQLSL